MIDKLVHTPEGKLIGADGRFLEGDEVFHKEFGRGTFNRYNSVDNRHCFIWFDDKELARRRLGKWDTGFPIVVKDLTRL